MAISKRVQRAKEEQVYTFPVDRNLLVEGANERAKQMEHELDRILDFSKSWIARGLERILEAGEVRKETTEDDRGLDVVTEEVNDVMDASELHLFEPVTPAVKAKKPPKGIKGKIHSEKFVAVDAEVSVKTNSSTVKKKKKSGVKVTPSTGNKIRKGAGTPGRVSKKTPPANGRPRRQAFSKAHMRICRSSKNTEVKQLESSAKKTRNEDEGNLKDPVVELRTPVNMNDRIVSSEEDDGEKTMILDEKAAGAARDSNSTGSGKRTRNLVNDEGVRSSSSKRRLIAHDNEQENPENTDEVDRRTTRSASRREIGQLSKPTKIKLTAEDKSEVDTVNKSTTPVRVGIQEQSKSDAKRKMTPVVKTEEPLSNSQGQVMRPILNNLYNNCLPARNGGKFFSKDLTKLDEDAIEEDEDADCDESPVIGKLMSKASGNNKTYNVGGSGDVESPVVGTSAPKTPLKACNDTFNVPVNDKSHLASTLKEPPKVSSCIKGKQSTGNTRFHVNFREHDERGASRLLRQQRTSHQTDNTYDALDATEVSTPKKKYPVSPYVSGLKDKQKQANMNALLEENEDEDEENSSPSRRSFSSSKDVAETPPVTVQKKTTVVSEHNVSRVHTGQQLDTSKGMYLHTSRIMPSPLSKTLGQATTPYWKKMQNSSALTGSRFNQNSAPRSNLVSNVKSFWNPNGLKSQKLDLNNKEKEEEAKKAAMLEKEKMVQDRLRMLQEKKKMETLEKKRMNEERLFKAKQNLANVQSSASASSSQKGVPPSLPPKRPIPHSGALYKYSITAKLNPNPVPISSVVPSKPRLVTTAGVNDLGSSDENLVQYRLPTLKNEHCYLKLTSLNPENSDDEMETDEEDQPKFPKPAWAHRRNLFATQKKRKNVKLIRRLKFSYRDPVHLPTVHLPAIFNNTKSVNPKYLRQRRSTAVWAPVINAKPDDTILIQ